MHKLRNSIEVSNCLQMATILNPQAHGGPVKTEFLFGL